MKDKKSSPDSSGSSSGTPKDSHYARLRRQFRDQKTGGSEQNSQNQRFSKRKPVAGTPAGDGITRLYGLHTVKAAIENPRRRIFRMMVTKNALARLELDEATIARLDPEMVEPRDIDTLTGSDAVHQGVMIETAALKPRKLQDLKEGKLLLILDQVTDPHNVGAILRSAVAFGADALITTSRHSPQESGVLAKSASGALEMIDQIEVRNLADAILELHELGYMTIGLDSEGPQEMEHALKGGKLALVLGAEGKGLRQKTRETVNALARLDMPGAIKSLNVSNAAAISLYAAQRFLSK
ncbi:TrmH family RNA methyltransferase [Pseudochrobactrum kiredjianiae]|uniref:TrmH family RNA methyltransferase n=1 Tax=Pseudochrobactrum kiredjianiae TaxID=386305 RepID=A0ABW3V325_9HYPH|nr:RNA methyltransferase [Pseudochrobactrum kiredjianiae]MDM7851248.1 RNA methyltransferase [Pseudochrobactrum kiredjianiae]